MQYFLHVKKLKFEERPDFDYLKRLFRDLFNRNGYKYDNMYDWEITAQEEEVAAKNPKTSADAESDLSADSQDEADKPVAPSELSGICDGEDDDIPGDGNVDEGASPAVPAPVVRGKPAATKPIKK